MRASISYGPKAAKQRVNEAYKLLNSLRVTEPGPSPWARFCRVAAGVDMTRLDVVTDPSFPSVVDSMRKASPDQAVAQSLKITGLLHGWLTFHVWGLAPREDGNHAEEVSIGVQAGRGAGRASR